MQNNLQRIRPDELHAELGQNAKLLIVDVRTAAEFESHHIAGAINIPLAQLPGKLWQIAAEQTVVLACRTDRRASAAAELLFAEGLAPKVLVGGVTAWRDQNFPVEEGKKSLPLDQQVQLIAGSFIVAGTLLGALVHKSWLIAPGLVGAGLVYAGLSGNCGLAMVLARAPWNRGSAPSDPYAVKL